MKLKAIIIVILCIVQTIAVDAQSVLSARTRLDLARLTHRLASPQHHAIDAFVELSPDCDVQQLQALGIQVQSQFGSIATVRLPLNALPGLEQVHGLKRVSLAQPMTLCNDSARYLSRVDDLHLTTPSSQPYTGKGVIVGVIDVGIDFHHINLCDSNGVSRVACAYLPTDTTGIAPVINGLTLPGSAYETPEAIAQLTTDCATNSHGSHTTGTAAGSYRGNAFYGVAPDATLVICGMPNNALTDVNIANSLNYIFHYADSVGLPAVVNMSISSQEGAHDGTSQLCQVMETLSGPGRVCVLAAGNDGDKAVHVHSPLLTATDTATVVLANSKQQPSVSGYVSMWSNNDTPHALRLALVNKTTGQVEAFTPYYQQADEVPDSVFHVNLSDAFGSDYAEDCVDFAFEQAHKYHSILAFSTTHLSGNRFLAVQFAPQGECELMGWSQSLRFADFKPGDPLWLAGNSEMSISDLATGNATISVGAYCSRAKAPVMSGSNNSLTDGAVRLDIASYSSYGPDVNGVMRPDVVAPGKSLVSSYNRYNPSDCDNPRWVNSYVTIDGERYTYGANTGTSMAAPVVTGAVALWLQANPLLTPDMVRDVLQQTSYRDRFVSQGDSRRWGYGKLDVTAGLRYLLTGTLRGDVNADGDINVSDVTYLINCLLETIPTDFLACDVNSDGEVNVSDLTTLINILLGIL